MLRQNLARCASAPPACYSATPAYDDVYPGMGKGWWTIVYPRWCNVLLEQLLRQRYNATAGNAKTLLNQIEFNNKKYTIITKIPNFTKYELWKVYILHFNILLKNPFLQKVRKCFGICCVSCIINRYFEYRIRILCIYLYMGT